jgi:hypothetical protein
LEEFDGWFDGVFVDNNLAVEFFVRLFIFVTLDVMFVETSIAGNNVVTSFSGNVVVFSTISLSMEGNVVEFEDIACKKASYVTT